MDNLSVYRELADCYDRLGQASMRDRFLILAADAALEAGQAAEAERLRQRLLQGSRHHMLRPYSSFAEALRAADVQTYLHDLRVNYPHDVSKQLLESLQEDAGRASADVYETQKMDWGDPTPAELPVPSTRPAPAIPPTAPLIDMGSPSRDIASVGGRPEERPTSPSRHLDRVETPPARAEQAAPSTRPLAQPLPGRTPPSRPAGSGQPSAASTPARPATGIPVAQPAASWPTLGIPSGARRAEGLAPASSAATAARQEREKPPNGGVWLNMLLVGVVFTSGLALAAFTLARPFLPPDWLP